MLGLCNCLVNLIKKYKRSRIWYFQGRRKNFQYDARFSQVGIDQLFNGMIALLTDHLINYPPIIQCNVQKCGNAKNFDSVNLNTFLSDPICNIPATTCSKTCFQTKL